VHRFFAPALDVGDDLVALPRDEAEHLTRVLRMSPGDTVAVFDGRGHEFLAKVASVDGRDVRVQLLSAVNAAIEPAAAVTLVQAVLKGDKMDELVRDAAMLGVVAVQPVVTRRTESTVAALMRGARLDRWRRIALASVKQCGRAILPEIRTPLTFADWLGEPRPELTLMLVEPGASTEVETLGWLRHHPTPAEAAIVVGPEGGWAGEELRVAQERGLRLVTLGRRTLRADAVPVAALSILQFLWD
jgi:16S rRNA (uracil1498-N3)-methyltransferase